MFTSLQVINLSQLNALLLSSPTVFADRGILDNCKYALTAVAYTIMQEIKDIAHYFESRKGQEIT